MAAVLTETDIELSTIPSSLSEWKPRGLSLRESPLQIWRANSEFRPSDLDHLRSLLSADEQQRAERFRFDKDRNQYISARGLLRTLLSGYLGTDPRQVKFCYSERGKPSLAGASDNQLSFNVAHSGSMILIGFSCGHRIGVDVERLRRDIEAMEIAQRFFSPLEFQTLGQLPEEERHLGFFLCWTRKEAYVKATGDGLSLPLNQFDVTLKPGKKAQLVATRPDANEAGRWRLDNLDIDPEYAAALVIERSSAGER